MQRATSGKAGSKGRPPSACTSCRLWPRGDPDACSGSFLFPPPEARGIIGQLARGKVEVGNGRGITYSANGKQSWACEHCSGASAHNPSLEGHRMRNAGWRVRPGPAEESTHPRPLRAVCDGPRPRMQLGPSDWAPQRVKCRGPCPSPAAAQNGLVHNGTVCPPSLAEWPCVCYCLLLCSSKGFRP